jgi:hypothetical protein
MMKLFNFVLPLALVAMPAVATANNHKDTKHESVKSIFDVNKDESFFKKFSKPTADLDNYYLVGASNKFSSYTKSDEHKQSSANSFQSKFESESNNWMGNHKYLTEVNYNHHSKEVGDSWNFKGSDWDHRGWGDHMGSGNNYHENNNYCHAPVPEPTTYALMLVGLLGLGFAKRRKS